MAKKVNTLIQGRASGWLPYLPEPSASKSEAESLRCLIQEMTEVMEVYLEGLLMEACENQLSR